MMRSLPRITPQRAGSLMILSTFSFRLRSTQFGMLCLTRAGVISPLQFSRRYCFKVNTFSHKGTPFTEKVSYLLLFVSFKTRRQIFIVLPSIALKSRELDDDTVI